MQYNRLSYLPNELDNPIHLRFQNFTPDAMSKRYINQKICELLSILPCDAILYARIELKLGKFNGYFHIRSAQSRFNSVATSDDLVGLVDKLYANTFSQVKKWEIARWDQDISLKYFKELDSKFCNENCCPLLQNIEVNTSSHK